MLCFQAEGICIVTRALKDAVAWKPSISAKSVDQSASSGNGKLFSLANELLSAVHTHQPRIVVRESTRTASFGTRPHWPKVALRRRDMTPAASEKPPRRATTALPIPPRRRAPNEQFARVKGTVPPIDSSHAQAQTVSATGTPAASHSRTIRAACRRRKQGSLASQRVADRQP